MSDDRRPDGGRTAEHGRAERADRHEGTDRHERADRHEGTDHRERADRHETRERDGPALTTDLRRAWTATRTELRALLRGLVSDRRQAAAVFLGFGAFAVLWPVILFDPITGFGARLASEGPRGATLGTVAAVVTAGVGTGVFLGVASAVNRNRVGSVGPLLRTSAPPRAVAFGRLFSELVQSVAFLLPVAVTVACVVGIGARDPFLPLLLAVGVAVPTLAALLAARTVGSTARLGGFLTGASVWQKAVGFVVVTLATIGGTQYALGAVLDEGPLGDTSGAFLPGRPMQAYTETALVPYGGGLDPTGVAVAVSAVALGVVALPVLGWVETRILLRDEGTGPAETSETGSERIPRPFTATLTTRIAWRHLRRTKRDPRSLAHLFTFVIGPFAGTGFLFAQPELATRVVGAGLAVLGTLVAGAAYCLNPLGDDRDQLPWLFTSLTDTGPLLRARVLAGVTIGAAVGLLGAPLAAVGFSPSFAVGQTALFVLLAPAAGGIALGIGAVAPKFERQEYLNVERAHPSQLALLGFFFGGSLVLSLGVVTLWLWTAGLVPAVGAVGLLVGYVLVVWGLAVGGYLYAKRRFDALTLDDV